MIDRDQVLHAAKLARLELSEAEVAGFTTQLASIIGHINQLDEADISGVDPTCFVAPSHDPLRDDAERKSLEAEIALANGPSVKKGHFAVPKVIGPPGGA
ncbi:MAG: Asp-tRNA(Asn)/Glu-tRNA(Gln) amidotransferase subunit GatC [Chitinispirillia bacterium]|nr:Asp-tRNA(Asn)/Glu-tRNA(Gln) amidotransferase subunit GatC [Chitinispirillia bacterium]MCL2267934.1 Asp-tRNA(Asn)/Glu-tRNA(Gln) amidotransferase subunit GatC [Chitinispirillia bacterium]